MSEIRLSPLPHTWIFDVDGVIVRHNGHKDGNDELLSGVRAFWDQIPPQDVIVLMTARSADEVAVFVDFLRGAGLRYDRILSDLPVGERILINDQKPSGLQTSIALNLTRDAGLEDITVRIDPTL